MEPVVQRTSAESWSQRRICAEELWSGLLFGGGSRRRSGSGCGGVRAPLWRCLGPFCGTCGLAHVRGVVVAEPYLCRAVEPWCARPSVEVSRPVLRNLRSSARPRSAVSVQKRCGGLRALLWRCLGPFCETCGLAPGTCGPAPTTDGQAEQTHEETSGKTKRRACRRWRGTPIACTRGSS